MNNANNQVKSGSYYVSNGLDKFSFHTPPKYVGYWELLENLKVSTTFKPMWLHRKMIKLMFGWTWHEGSAIK